MTRVTSAMCASDGAPVLLVRELDDRVRPVVEQALEPPELALGVLADPVRHLDVLALDDGPHAAPPGLHRVVVRVSSRGWAPRSGHRSRATVTAETPSAPAASRAAAQAARVAPVVTTSSTSRIQRPPGRAASTPGSGEQNAPARSRARRARSRSNWAIVARARASDGDERAGRAGGPRPGDQRGLVVAALRARVGVDRDTRHEPSPPTPTAAQRRATAAPSGSARRRSPAYLSAWSASRTTPVNGAHHSSWSSGSGGRRAARSGRRPAGQPGVERRQAPGRAAAPSRPQPRQVAGSAASSARVAAERRHR